MQKTAISLAVACALSTSISYADEILFPQVISSPTVTTLLSVINNDNPGTSVHYRYYYKTVDSDPCEEVNFSQPSSTNDVVTFDVGGQFGNSQAVLFEPGSENFYTKSFAVFKPLPQVRAFAVVDNNTQTKNSGPISGEAVVLQFTEGSAWSYQAYNAAPIKGVNTKGETVVGNPYDFSDRGETAGEVLVALDPKNPEDYWVPVTLMPFTDLNVRSALLITPIGTETPYQLSPTIQTTVGLRVDNPNTPAPNVFYDRDENPYSGIQDHQVTCVGRVDIPQFLSEATRQLIATSGGWTNVAVLKGQAVVFKLDYSDSTSQIDGKSVGTGSLNAVNWLRKGPRESIPRTGFPSYIPDNVSFSFRIPEESPYPLIDIQKATAQKLPFPPSQANAPIDYIVKGLGTSTRQ